MTAAQTLRKARALLAGGWTNKSPIDSCERSDGTPCSHNDEGVAKFSIDGAMRAAATNERALEHAWSILEWVVAPAHAAYAEHIASLPKRDEEITIEFAQKSIDLARACVDKPYIEQWVSDRRRTLDEILRAFNVAAMRALREREP